MPRIRRGGKRIRGANGGRTRNEDCCCDEPIPCATINDQPTRSTWEVSYEINGLSLGTQTCGASCNSVAPLSGIVGYVGAGFPLDWYKKIPICGNRHYELNAGIRCVSGTVFLELSLVVSSDSMGSIWAISWADSVPEASFILGNVFVLPRQSAVSASGSVCLPTPSNGIGTTADFVVTVA